MPHLEWKFIVVEIPVTSPSFGCLQLRVLSFNSLQHFWTLDFCPFNLQQPPLFVCLVYSFPWNIIYWVLVSFYGTPEDRTRLAQNLHSKCLNYDSFPKYLKDMFTLRQSGYSFRKTDILSLCKPVTTTYGLNSFRYFASKNWNSLPNNVRSESTLSNFRRLLKTISF